MLAVLAKQSSDILRAENQELNEQDHETTATWDESQQQLKVQSLRFQNRMRGEGKVNTF
jgi:hypothetical protein